MKNLHSFTELILCSSVVQVDNEIQSESQIVRNEKFCTLCEEFASQALYYLGKNETQTQVISILYKACSKLHSLEQQVCYFLSWEVTFDCKLQLC